MGNAEHLIERSDTLKHMGLTVVEQTANVLKIVMRQDGNRNHLGGIYAGAIFSLAECPFGIMCINKFGTHEIVPVIGEMTIRFLAPANSDLLVELTVSDSEWEDIDNETKKHGKFKIVKEIEVKDNKGRVNTIVKATYFTLDVRNKNQSGI
ncbi:acyl-coenzyme A thioesterase PaaI-like protein [Oxalobacteraceae bacterium GrIS 2.11]